MTKTEKIKTFNEFKIKFETAYCQYCMWKALQDKKFEEMKKENRYFWAYITDALLFAYSAGLAKLTEKQNKRDNEVLSIFYLLEYKLEDSNDTIEKLRKLRNKVLMHHDLKTALNIKKFVSKLGLRYLDIENLFNKLIKIMSEIAPDFDTNLNYPGRCEEMKKKCEKDLFNFIESKTNH